MALFTFDVGYKKIRGKHEKSKSGNQVSKHCSKIYEKNSETMDTSGKISCQVIKNDDIAMVIAACILISEMVHAVDENLLL